MPTVAVNEHRLFYARSGNGRSLLFVHGNPGTHRLWQHQLDYFQERYDVVAVDMRGYGQSDKPVNADYHPSALACDIAGLIEVLGLDRPVLIGLSMGSMVGLSLAIEFPGRIAGLVLAGATSDRRDRDPARELVRLAALGFEHYLRELVNSWYILGADPGLIEWTLAEVLTTELHVREATIRALASFNVTDRLHEIAVPALIMAGEKDITAPYDRARTIVDRIPDSELVIIPDTAHMFIAEAPDHVNSVIDAFLQKILYR